MNGAVGLALQVRAVLPTGGASGVTSPHSFSASAARHVRRTQPLRWASVEAGRQWSRMAIRTTIQIT